MILQFSILFGFLAIGELIVYLTGIPIPSSIIGMILLTIALRYGEIKESWIKSLCEFLIRNIAFFFVPAGIGLLDCFDIIKSQWIPVIIATVVSTVLVMAFTGWVHQLSHRFHSHFQHNRRCP